MASDRPTPIDYASRKAITPRPTHHSPFALASWTVLILEAIYRGSVVAYAYHKSPTYPFERFDRNVGDRLTFVRIDQMLFLLGIVLAIAALVQPRRKRWLACLALAAHVFLFYAVGGLEWELGLVRY